MLMDILSKPKPAARKPTTFFVHDMLATSREEKVPFCKFSLEVQSLSNLLMTIIDVLDFKQRHVKETTKDVHVERPVFEKWKADTPDVIGQMFAHDKTQWNIRDACETVKENSGLEGMII